MSNTKNGETLNKLRIMRIRLLILAIFPAAITSAQSGGANNALNNSLMVLIGLVVLTAIVLLAENLLKVEARRNNISTSSQDTSVFPGIRSLFEPKPPAYSRDFDFHRLTKGFDLSIEGKAEKVITDVQTNTYAVQPTNFNGIAPIPKMVVAEGDEVLAGDPLFFNKKTPDIKYVAPVSGEIAAINRGAKRAITEVVILADKDIRYRELPDIDIETADRAQIAEYLIKHGFWPLIKQRPYDLVADPDTVPRDIFISTFSTAPLAPDHNVIVEGNEEAFQKGLDALGKMTDGHVFLGLDGNGDNPPAKAYMEASGVEKHFFRGKHPAGNVGVQIHHIKPIGIGEVVWTLDVQDVIILGNMFLQRRFDARRIVALTGNALAHGGYVRTHIGANVGDLVGDVLQADDEVRLISGDVLTGEAKNRDQFINARENQLTAIPEGDYYEMFGWLIPSKMRPTISKTFPNFLFPSAEYNVDTNTHGEKRAFVVTGQYESVLPMDIYPQALMKAIMARDFERMQGLGIHELAKEDIALCEFACTSKMPLQEILEEGQEYMIEQG